MARHFTYIPRPNAVLIGITVSEAEEIDAEAEEIDTEAEEIDAEAEEIDMAEDSDAEAEEIDALPRNSLARRT